MDKVPQCQAKNGNSSSRGCAVKTQPFCGQHTGQLHAAGGFREHKGRCFRAPAGRGFRLCSAPACSQMDGSALSALNDLSGAHGKLLSLEGIKVKQRVWGWAVRTACQSCQH